MTDRNTYWSLSLSYNITILTMFLYQNFRFDQKVKGAVLTNTLGTKRVLTLAKEMTNLDVSMI